MRRHLLGVIVILAGAVVTVALAASAPGADAETGVEVVVRVVPWSGGAATSSEVAFMQRVLRARLQASGFAGSVADGPAARTIDLRIESPRVTARDISVLLDVARLDLYDLQPALVPPSRSSAGDAVPTRNLCSLLPPRRKYGAPAGYYLVSAACRLVVGPAPTLHRQGRYGLPGLLDQFGGSVPSGDRVLALPPQATVVTCSAVTTVVCPGDSSGVPPSGQIDYYLFKHGAYPGDRYGPYPSIGGEDVQASTVAADVDPTTGRPIVIFGFDTAGNATFREVTRNEAQRGKKLGAGSACAVQCAFAIVLNSELRSWPTIDPTFYPQGIDPSHGGVEITGVKTATAAQHLAALIVSGTLPARLVAVYERKLR